VSTLIAIVFLRERPHVGVLVGTALVVGGHRPALGQGETAHRRLSAGGTCCCHSRRRASPAQTSRSAATPSRFSPEPLFFAAVMGGVSLLCLVLYL
jgi:hypothetical protein